MSVDKKGKTREEIIKWRLGNMTKMAEEVRRTKDLKTLAKENKYIRIGGEAYRAVSLNANFPLCGFTRGKSENLETIDKHFKKEIDESLSLAETVLENKEERRLQCWLIRESLRKDRDLKSTLNLSNSPYDELLFAVDEVSLGDKNHGPIYRCDILAVGVNESRAFPVLIELKSNRSKKTLEDQLENFCKEIRNHKNEFSSLLGICTGKKVLCDNPRKMIIWPKNDSAQATAHRRELNNKKIDVIEYTVTGSNMNDIQFNASFF